MKKERFRIRYERHLSRNFKVREVFASETANRKGIINVPNDRREMAMVLRNARALARNVLQPIRDKFGVVKITSWYRCAILNDVIGGTAKSQHLLGEAADFVMPEADLFEVFQWLSKIKTRMDLDIDQVIHETRETSRLIHISHKIKRLKKFNRHESLLSTARGNYAWYA